MAVFQLDGVVSKGIPMGLTAPSQDQEIQVFFLCSSYLMVAIVELIC